MVAIGHAGPAGHYDAVYALLRELLRQYSVIYACDQARRLLTHVSGTDAKCFGYPYKYAGIQPGVAFYDILLIAQEIAGEGGIAYDIGTAFMAYDIFKL